MIVYIINYLACLLLMWSFASFSANIALLAFSQLFSRVSPVKYASSRPDCPPIIWVCPLFTVKYITVFIVFHFQCLFLSTFMLLSVVIVPNISTLFVKVHVTSPFHHVAYTFECVCWLQSLSLVVSFHVPFILPSSHLGSV